MQPIRVLYVLNATGGGATQGIVELLRHLPAGQYEAYLVLPNAPNERQQAIFSQVAKQTFVVPMTWWNQAMGLPLLWRFLSWARGMLGTLGHLLPVWRLCQIIRTQKIDIVYTSTIVVLDGALAAKLCGVPHIWHIKEWFGQARRVKFGLPDGLLAWLIEHLSTCVVVMTEFIGGFFQDRRLGGKLRVIYDGVNLDDFQGELHGADLRQELGIQNNKFVVGMAASLSSTWKEHDVFIDMAALLASEFPEMVFVAFGPEPKKHGNPAYNHPWWYYQGLREKVTRLGLDRRFIWAGFCANIPQMMDAMDILVHPCSHEPFGRVAIEAMAAHRPVIGPNCGGIAESVVHQATGLLVDPGNPGSFAAGVRFFALNPKKSREFGLNGYEHARVRFSIEEHVKQLIRLYQSCTELHCPD